MTRNEKKEIYFVTQFERKTSDEFLEIGHISEIQDMKQRGSMSNDDQMENFSLKIQF